MLEIQIHAGPALDLPDDFKLNFVVENPLFLQDRIPAAYTVQFEIPATIKNLQVFGMPNRIAANGLQKRLPADVIHYGYIMSRGELILTGSDRNPKVQFVGNTLLGDMNKNLNQLELGTYDYGEYPLVASDFDYANAWAEDYVNAAQLAATTGNPYVVAPMKIKDTDWEGEVNTDGVKNSVINYINYFNPFDQTFFLGGYTRGHSPIMPMPYLKDIIELVFGDKLESNPFATGDFAKLVLPTFNHRYFSPSNLIGYYPDHMLNWIIFLNPLVESYDYDENTVMRDFLVKMKSFQQAYPVMSLVKNVLKMFSMTMFTGRNYRIEKNDDIMARTVIRNWDDKIAGTPIVSYEPAKDYVFNFGETTSVITANVDKYANLSDIHDAMMEVSDNTDTLVQDSSTGAIYKMNAITVSHFVLTHPRIIRSEVSQSPLCVYYAETEREKYEVSSEVKPVDLNLHTCWGETDPELRYHWVVPEIELKDIKAPPYIMFYGGMNNIFGNPGSYPQLQAHNYDQFGVKKFDFSLLPGGADGLISKFHSKFKAWVEKDKLRLKTSVRLLPADLRALDIRDKYFISGRLFYIEKLEFELSHNNISLVEADMIEC